MVKEIRVNATKIEFEDDELGATRSLKQLSDGTYVTGGNTPITGWIPAGTFTYASASSITVASGAVSIYRIGDKLRFKQGGGYQYYYIITVADTLLTVTGGSDWTVLNIAITDMAYSHIENPLGFPATFNFTTTPTAEGSAYTNAPTINKAIFWIKGNMATVRIQWIFNATSGGTGNCLFTLPITASYQYQTGYGGNISAVTSLAVRTGSNNTSVTVGKYDGTTPIANSNMCEITIAVTI